MKKLHISTYGNSKMCDTLDGDLASSKNSCGFNELMFSNDMIHGLLDEIKETPENDYRPLHEQYDIFIAIYCRMTLIYCTRRNFRGVKIFVDFVVYYLPRKLIHNY